MPKIDRNLVKNIFKIEMMFEQMGDGGEKETDWYYGVVVDIVNPKKRVVEIKWDDECLHEGDTDITAQKLNVSMWNMVFRLFGQISGGSGQKNRSAQLNFS